MSITAKELAKQLNLSEAAISMALNNKPGVSTLTRKRVLEAAASAGYDFSRISNTNEAPASNGTLYFVIYRKNGAEVPNSPVYTHTEHGVLVQDVPFFSQLSEGIDLGCRHCHYYLNISYIYENDDIETLLSEWKRLGAKGILLLGTEMEKHDIQHENLIGSPIHIQRVIQNIESNAIKYNKPNGNLKIVVEEKFQQDTRTIFRITISDTGIGMNEEFKKHIFEPFSRENENAGTQYMGTGLGMAITKELLELMNGSITVDSTLGEGTVFVVEIPCVIDKNASQKREEKDAVIDNLSGLNILVVEDNKINAEIAEYILKKSGAEVTLANNGKEAVDVFAETDENYYDIILMDVMMPVMNGYEATRNIRKLHRKDAKKIPIIAMTANAFTKDKLDAIEAGMNEHIAKPLDINLLLEIISKYKHKISRFR